MQEVLDAAQHPDMEYPGALGHAEGRRVACKGRLAVIIQPEEHTIVTVLWNKKQKR